MSPSRVPHPNRAPKSIDALAPGEHEHDRDNQEEGLMPEGHPDVGGSRERGVDGSSGFEHAEEDRLVQAAFDRSNGPPGHKPRRYDRGRRQQFIDGNEVADAVPHRFDPAKGKNIPGVQSDGAPPHQPGSAAGVHRGSY